MSTTGGGHYRIQVTSEVFYVAEQSNPQEQRFVFAYRMTIHNTGSEAARLLSRHWIITDANGEVREVRGEGVVGKQPLIEPGTRYQYTSGSMLETPVGSMRGSYRMRGPDGHEFDAEIPAFTLAQPGVIN
jgi:ApaG protein